VIERRVGGVVKYENERDTFLRRAGHLILDYFEGL
jgi:hypothetical protein